MKTKGRYCLSAIKTLTFILWASVLAACASDDVLFAEYDLLCRTDVCLAPATEVIYQVEIDAVAWEPAVYFGYDLSALDETETNRLENNIQVLLANPGLKISLQAFTDANNTVSYNIALSNRRRITVNEYLTENGIEESRIVASIAGESLPIHGGNSVREQAINRRVEMMLLDSTGVPLGFDIVLPDGTTSEFVPPYPDRKLRN